MLSNTTLSALKILIHLAQRRPAVVPPRRIAEELGESPTYLSKVATQLTKAGILRTERGPKGGVQLAKGPSDITLLDIFEACQGAVVGAYCQSKSRPSNVCSFHRAAQQLESAIRESLGDWTLQRLLTTPSKTGRSDDEFPCMMLGPKHASSVIGAPGSASGR